MGHRIQKTLVSVCELLQDGQTCNTETRKGVCRLMSMKPVFLRAVKTSS
jgi:hypothetical protein